MITFFCLKKHWTSSFLSKKIHPTHSLSKNAKGTLGKPAKHQTGVVPAESEAIAHSHLNRHFSRLIWYVIKITLRIWCFKIYRRWNHVVLERLCTGHQFNAATGSKRVAQMALDA